MIKRIALGMMFCLVAVSSQAATKIYLKGFKNSDTSLGQLYNYANPTAAPDPSFTTSVTDTTAGGTAIQWTDVSIVTATPVSLKWISPPLSSGVTISGTVTMNTWAYEDDALANTTVAFTVKKYTGGAESTALFTGNAFGSELPTSVANQSWTTTPTSVVFSAGDRIVLIGIITNAGGTMATGHTVTVDYATTTGAADGDTWVQFNESLSFASEAELLQVGTGINFAGSTVSGAFPGTTNTGELLLALTDWFDPTPPTITSITDSSSNTWSIPAGGGPVSVDAASRTQVGFSANATGGSPNTVTVNFSGTTASILYLEAWKGMQSSQPDSVLQNANGTSTTPTTPSFTPTLQPELIFCPMYVTGAVIFHSAPAQQVDRAGFGGGLYDYVLTTASAQTCSETIDSAPWGVVIGGFKITGSAAPSSGFADEEIFFLGY